jgi:type II secretory pathway component PulL
MTPDAVTWNGQWRQPTTASPLHARAGEPAAAKDAARAAETAALDGTAVIPDADAMPDPAVPVRRAWIAAAIADAERNRAAVQAGRNPEPLTSPIPPESLAATMVHALEKYRAMMIARNGGPGGT